MILRRFTQHLKEQDWFAVGLELCVVIVGIFLGMQVSDWNDDRKQREIRQGMLSTLKAELQSSKAAFQSALEWNMINRDRAITTLNALKRCEALPGEDQDIVETFKNYQSILSISINRASFDEMTASGQFAAIEDRLLKTTISEIYFRFDLLEQFQVYMRRDLTTASRIIWEYVDLGFEDEASEDGWLAVTASVNLLDHCGERAFRNAVWEVADSYQDWSLVALRLLESVDLAIELLDQQ